MNGTAERLLRDDPALVAFWGFAHGNLRPTAGATAATLDVFGTAPAVAPEGVFGESSLDLDGRGMLFVPRIRAGRLIIGGPAARLSVVAWVKRRPNPERPKQCQAIAGVWNEHGLRQYCLFLNLQIFDSSEQVAAHVSASGGATPGYKYCMEAAIGATPVEYGAWHTIGMTYDGREARAYLDGALDLRRARNPLPSDGGLYDPSAGGADFTVGAVRKPVRVAEDRTEVGSEIGNFYHGLLGGLAVFDRSLTSREMAALSALADDGSATSER